MNKVESFAARLHGREYRKELTTSEELEAKVLGIVVVFAYSDDNAELRGTIDAEVDCYDGGVILISEHGVFEGCECECKWSKEARSKCRIITAVWHNESGPCWTYGTTIPHATFDIMEDGEVFCRGIVFDIKSLEAAQ